MTATRRLVEALVACRSVTPIDGGCQRIIAERLAAIGFDCHALPFGDGDAAVSNLWAVRRGSDPSGRVLAFAGHTDVVPTGPLAAWRSDPFVPSERDGRLHGRGTADMKSSLAAMVVAVEEFVAGLPGHAGSVGFLLTSDEEGPATNGTVRVCDWLRSRGERLDGCIVGEPTSVAALGDTVKNGRRGTLSGRLTIRGVQGHIAYPQLARNPIHAAAPLLAELAGVVWDEGDAHFPPTSWQVSNFHAGTGAGNVIPGEATIDFNFRFGTASTAPSLQTRLAAIVERHAAAHGVGHDLSWTLGGEPFLTPTGALCDALAASIAEHAGVRPEVSTTGGTSDGRFIARICREVVEFGPVNASIHQVDEHIELASLEPLKNVYRGVLERLVA